jgi:hypothetical protein
VHGREWRNRNLPVGNIDVLLTVHHGTLINRNQLDTPSLVFIINPLNAELNHIYHLLALLAHLILHVSRIRVKNQCLYMFRASLAHLQEALHRCIWCNCVRETCVDCVLVSVRKVYLRSQWPRGLRRRSAAARLLRFWVRIPPGAWKSVCCECCVLSGRGLCDELITRPEESYRL